LSAVYPGTGTNGMVSPGGQYLAVASSTHGGSGKRGRNAIVDDMMSQRGGEANFAPRRMGKFVHQPYSHVNVVEMRSPPAEADDRLFSAGQLDSERMQGWFTPSSHNSNCHDPMSVRMDPAGALRSESGFTKLGGGKKGRDPSREMQMSHSGKELWKSPQSKPQMDRWGTMTGGGAKGRNVSTDRAQSSNATGGLW